jgi:arginyl-tRNA synthetase
MDILANIQEEVAKALLVHYECDADSDTVLINQTRADFDGDYTVVLFPYIKKVKRSPDELGDTIGKHLKERIADISDFNIVKGFLNVSLSDEYLVKQVDAISQIENYGDFPKRSEKVMVEFSSPNTNKPLHLGHIRTILLGWSMSKIYEKAGYDVIKTCIANDRGIAICKSMTSWKNYGNGETPESTGMKGDFLVGKYYVEFDKQLTKEYQEWQGTNIASELFQKMAKEKQTSESFFKGYKNSYFNEHSAIGKQVKEMLLKWEDGDEETKALWNQMNNWVYDGHNSTYKNLGVHFDQIYYESETYLKGKDVVLEGLKDNTFYKEKDGSIWVDLENVGLDKKIILRSDGTSVYLTQDLGTADVRYEEHGAEKMVYVVGDEQDYHFKVLFEIMKKLGRSYANGLYHLSYGMIDLPTGKMKSREGTVVDADDLVNEVIGEARKGAQERGEVSQLEANKQEEVFERIGLGALKFFILKVNPKKRMMFNPQESVDMQGQTGPYIQNAFVRISSIFRKLTELPDVNFSGYALEPAEKELVKSLLQYPQTIEQAANNYDPSLIANYSYVLAKQFHKMYHDVRILSAESEEAMAFRLRLSKTVGNVLESSLNLLGIEMPERM